LLSTGIQKGSVNWQDQVWRLKEAFIDTVFPPVCASCGQVGQLFCSACRLEVQWIVEPICFGCGRPQAQPIDSCLNCRNSPLPLERNRAAVLYVDPVRTVIHRLKFDGFFALAQPLAELMLEAWPRWRHDFDLIVPIPLHPNRQRQRGFNQSELLVRQLCKRLGWVGDQSALKRNRWTRPQIGLSASERRDNVDGAFEANHAVVSGKRILLVDDVFTTGSTLASATRALLDAGAASVTGYCLAGTDDRLEPDYSEKNHGRIVSE
jgi:ComF family protein